MNNTVVCLIGHYGVGKLTVAREVCARTNARLFDNHLVNNVIFSLIDADGTSQLPRQVWDLVWEIREQAYRAIETIAPPEFSYVLTAAVIDSPRDRQVFERIETMVRHRAAAFVPVVLTCSDAAFAERVPTAERAARLKHIDVSTAAEFRRHQSLLPVDHPNALHLDTTAMTPQESAAAIIAHAEPRP